MLTNKNSVDEYLEDGCGRCSKFKTSNCKVHSWKELLVFFRQNLLKSGLTEEIKWGQPTYTWEKQNVVLLAATSDCVVLSFFKGSMLNDPQNLLCSPGPNSQLARLLKVENFENIEKQVDSITEWIDESKMLIKNGFKRPPSTPIKIPFELLEIFDIDEEYQLAFDKLTPGRQRSYLIHFTGGKKSTTRTNRIVKCRNKVISGKGFNER